jgi:hypothetical protein
MKNMLRKNVLIVFTAMTCTGLYILINHSLPSDIHHNNETVLEIEFVFYAILFMFSLIAFQLIGNTKVRHDLLVALKKIKPYNILACIMYLYLIGELMLIDNKMLVLYNSTLVLCMAISMILVFYPKS